MEDLKQLRNIYSQRNGKNFEMLSHQEKKLWQYVERCSFSANPAELCEKIECNNKMKFSFKNVTGVSKKKEKCKEIKKSACKNL